MVSCKIVDTFLHSNKSPSFYTFVVERWAFVFYSLGSTRCSEFVFQIVDCSGYQGELSAYIFESD